MTAPWTDAATVRARDGAGTLTDDQVAAAIESASDLLDRLTMSQFGIKDDVVRPEGCGRRCDVGAPSERAVVGWGLSQPLASRVGPWPLAGPAGGMVDWCTGCGDRWGSAVDLLGPVTEIAEVRVDGDVLDPTAYQVWDGRRLIRSDGSRWPSCQNLRLDPATDANTFQVSYSYGVPVPAMGKAAATSLAVELAKMYGYIGGICQLPQRVTQVVRQSVTVAMVDPYLIIQQGGTGLNDVDMWLHAVMKGPRRARIATPGYEPELRRRTI